MVLMLLYNAVSYIVSTIQHVTSVFHLRRYIFVLNVVIFVFSGKLLEKINTAILQIVTFLTNLSELCSALIFDKLAKLFTTSNFSVVSGEGRLRKLVKASAAKLFQG